MQFIPGLLQHDYPLLKGKQWYHQRFDGCPLLMHTIAEAELRSDARKHGCGKGTRICFFTNHRADWYIAMDDIHRISQTLLDLARKNPNLSKELMGDWRVSEAAFYATCLEISRMDLSAYSVKDLLALFHEFCEIGYSRFSSSSLIDGFALGTDEVIAGMIQQHLKKKGCEQEFAALFSYLTAPVHPSFINQAEVSLLKIALLMGSNTELKEYVLNHPTDQIIGKLHESHPAIARLLELHVTNYFWSRNNYVDAHFLGESFFLNEIKDLLSSGEDLAHAIERITTTPHQNKSKKQQLITKLELDPFLVTLLTISEDFTHWQDERKKATYWNAHYMLMIAEEIGKHFGLSLEEVKYLTHPEIMQLPIQVPDHAALATRARSSVLYWSDFGMDLLCDASEVENFRLMLLGLSDYQNITSLKGLCANIGRAKGPVKVCKSSTEVAKVQSGDILVAVMTRPDYVIGMKKAGAIVTNEGGITSHAAIVSREMGIPCVIGTKVATEVLKDGDIVEVIAEEGVVHIVQRS